MHAPLSIAAISMMHTRTLSGAFFVMGTFEINHGCMAMIQMYHSKECYSILAI